jgi:hypothetical protein
LDTDSGQNIKDSALTFYGWKEISAQSCSGREVFNSDTGGKLYDLDTDGNKATTCKRPADGLPPVTFNTGSHTPGASVSLL